MSRYGNDRVVPITKKKKKNQVHAALVDDNVMILRLDVFENAINVFRPRCVSAAAAFETDASRKTRAPSLLLSVVVTTVVILSLLLSLLLLLLMSDNKVDG